MTPAQAHTVEDFRPLAYRIAGRYYLPGGDRDDLRQEALFGVFKALRDHRPERGRLEAFVVLCVERHLASKLKGANAEKHHALNDSQRTVRLFETDGTVDLVTIDEFASDPRADVESLVLQRERLHELRAAMRTLTDSERRALCGVANGVPYTELGPPKQVDNAVQRARRKLAA